ncbi:MAG TPA: hypothetical protein ENO21_04655 [Firmicutes bacterium]|nr:hypothetical protein [Bacillota bacterium]
MGRWRRARLILALWAVAVLCLVLYAVIARHTRQDRIAARAVAELTADAESGTVEGSDYLYGFGWQGPMVDLIERGRHYPEMERVMLLLEARRVYDWIYLYPQYRNADLREGLVRHCLEHYPDDPKVHWAVGRLQLVAGDYESASDEFDKAVKLASHRPWRTCQRSTSRGAGRRPWCWPAGRRK